MSGTAGSVRRHRKSPVWGRRAAGSGPARPGIVERETRNSHGAAQYNSGFNTGVNYYCFQKRSKLCKSNKNMKNTDVDVKYVQKVSLVGLEGRGPRRVVSVAVWLAVGVVAGRERGHEPMLYLVAGEGALGWRPSLA